MAIVDKTSLCVLHSLDRLEMFTELYREEKRKEGDRGGQEDKGGNHAMKEPELKETRVPRYSSQHCL